MHLLASSISLFSLIFKDFSLSFLSSAPRHKGGSSRSRSSKSKSSRGRSSRESLQSNISLSVENGQVAKYKGSSSTYLNFKKMRELFSPNIHLKKQCIGNKSLLHSVCHYRLPQTFEILMLVCNKVDKSNDHLLSVGLQKDAQQCFDATNSFVLIVLVNDYCH